MDARDQIRTVTQLGDIVEGVLRCCGEATLNEILLKNSRNKQLHEVHKVVIEHLGLTSWRLLKIKVLDRFHVDDSYF